MIELKPVQSSNIQAIGHDPVTATLHVQFTSGTVYEYTGVPAELFAQFEAADSKGRFFAKEIRPKFTGTKYLEPTVAEIESKVVLDGLAAMSDQEKDRIAMSQAATRDMRDMQE